MPSYVPHMTDASDGRAANLLGALALTVVDRIERGAQAATARPRSDTAALVVLTTTLSGASQNTLGAVLGLSQSGATRLVDRLVVDDLVERRPGPDARTIALVPTPTGTALARSVLDARRRADVDLLASLDDAECRQLTALLEKLLGRATTDRAAAYVICRLCDPVACGDPEGRCPVTHAADVADERHNDP